MTALLPFEYPQRISLHDFQAQYLVDQLSLFHLTDLFKRTGRSLISQIIKFDAVFVLTGLTRYIPSDNIQVIINPVTKVVYTGLMHLCTFLKYGQPQDQICVSFYDPARFDGTEVEAYSHMPKQDLVVEVEDGWHGIGNLLIKLCHDPEVEKRWEAVSQVNQLLDGVFHLNILQD
jgi:hypothetical protein